MNRALESILLSVLSALEAEMVFIRNLVGGLLAELEDDIDHDRFKRLLHYSRRLASFQNRARLVSYPSAPPYAAGADRPAMYNTGAPSLWRLWFESSSRMGTPTPRGAETYFGPSRMPLGQSPGTLRHASSVP